ncbi:glycosyltransferase family 29 protein [Streptomyces actinomycinicus]|uniref:glycosyltransferase family 29 protein n=1 Tax=Streptomyces actinomycinicus TaxID=1695166 RepID=UPI001F188FD0|nr:glycosyltransferase family 29 protein [Streptomyces actinomycinicus]
MRGPVADPTVGGVRWIGLGEFRNQIAGKSICLVANSGRVGASALGAEIDGYDLVVRFNSYRIGPEHTGSRTDIHATIHKHGFNWVKPVTTRLVFGGVAGDWKHSLRNRLVPGAQQHLGDESLRWPVRYIGRLGTDAWSGIPTTGFNMLWLLDPVHEKNLGAVLTERALRILDHHGRTVADVHDRQELLWKTTQENAARIRTILGR